MKDVWSFLIGFAIIDAFILIVAYAFYQLLYGRSDNGGGGQEPGG